MGRREPEPSAPFFKVRDRCVKPDPVIVEMRRFEREKPDLAVDSGARIPARRGGPVFGADGDDVADDRINLRIDLLYHLMFPL